MSATVRVTTPWQARNDSPMAGPTEIRPRLGLSPTRPQQAAGMRIEPPPSLACASGTIPAATAAADPPLDPPGVRDRSHGLRVGPPKRGSVVGRIANSGRFVVPTITKPASRSRETRNASWSGRKPSRNLEPKLSGKPLTDTLPLTAIGTPANGCASPGLTWSAAASARSPSTATNAFSAGSRASIRRNAASTTSRALASPLRTSAEISTAEANAEIHSAGPYLLASSPLLCAHS